MMTPDTPEMQSKQAYCRSCEAITDHRVVEAKGKKSSLVRCDDCHDTHPFRAKQPAARKKRLTAKAKSSELGFDGAMRGRDATLATKYDMTHHFGDDELIDHAVFGLGLVTRVLVDQKIEVRFRDGIKLLAHER